MPAGHADPPLIVSQDGSKAIWTLTLNRPGKANALDAETVERLLATVADARAAGARALVLEGAGRNFCAGFDFAGYQEQSAGDLLHRFVRIEQLGFPPRGGGVRSERHAAMRILTSLIAARASSGVR